MSTGKGFVAILVSLTFGAQNILPFEMTVESWRCASEIPS